MEAPRTDLLPGTHRAQLAYNFASPITLPIAS